LVNFNLPPGDWAGGERGIAALPGREAEFRASVETALSYARATGAERMHVMAGLARPGDAEAEETYRRNLRHAAERFAHQSLDVLIEPLNHRDMPGYFLDDFHRASRLVEELALPNLKVQFDVYHRQILHGDVATGLRQMMHQIGHVQIASVPSRHEPDGEELSFAFLCEELDRLGYAGHIGCEYRPRADTVEGLAWFVPFARSRGGA
jgi:hydroxypyruvate isomerase